ncbi:WhiB family transcriptional regulator [Pseudactinotalea sp. Z1732]|uniref:WhiB family transcriptional regulator n=1 Tax=Micrococcales TaxID=85006 RepID=UPI003C7B9303
MQYTSILDQPSGSSTTWPLDAGPLVAVVQVDLPCQDVTTSDLWFAEHTQQIEQAKALCQACPLKAECLDGALARREPWGVWGGEVLVDGAIVARKRGRGRPRKDDPSATSNHRTTSAA